MSVEWTREQSQVIESRGSNLLVSAAAGSGKTAVLVERIIQMVTDKEHPLDIDRLLVMTFTNAAAAEMRERIGYAIERKLRETPEDEHLQTQAALVHHAQITTIDSFCVNLIRNHFNLLDLDPAFQIGDEGELLLLRADAMQELLEDCYEHGGENFERFVETYAQGKSDAGIEEYIMQVYTFSQSNPYPGQWFARCRQELREPEDDKAARQFPWMDFLMEDIKRQVKEWKQQLIDAIRICREDDYICVYEPMLQEDYRLLSAVGEAGDFPDLLKALSAVVWCRLATVRSKEADQEKKAYVTGCRDRIKKAVAKMKELYAFGEWEEMIKDMAGTSGVVETLLGLAEEFSRRFQEKKRDRNLVDFNDLEHEALKVLIHFESGEIRYTEAADQIAMQYEEVLVDEYQDSNLVQEALLGAVSRERFGHPNVFMVGDVKQSIYKFRLARPELFLEKYHSYIRAGLDTKTEGDKEAGASTVQGIRGRKIELHKNFRSREQVLAGINDVFYRIMTENLGNIRYTEETALHPGAQFAEGPEIDCPELLVVDTGTEILTQMEEDAADYTARELEAKLIAAKIREMTDKENGIQVWDKNLGEAGCYRTAQYRDMVILLRSTSGWTETLLSVLMNEGIPAYAESRMGYFHTPEVETMLSMLAVIDNPMQDIPLASVLKSAIVGLSDKNMAQMMAVYGTCADKGQDRGIYGAMKYCLETEKDQWVEKLQEKQEGQAEQAKQEGEIIRQKLGKFLTLLRQFRSESTYLPIHELIYHVFAGTGYYDYISAMPAGETRRANLDMLVEKASVYEKTSYKGLFHFIRYIENLKKYRTDFGEASTLGEEDNTVRIMSIHKSKGLEFPIVFLAGMGKKFNRQDLYKRVLIDPELGIGTDYLDLEHRLKTTTLKKNVLRRKMDLDSLGEELRVLYVAMTRAKERLIMTGTDRSLGKKREKYEQVPVIDGQIPFTVLSAANSYLDWLLMSLGDGKVRIRMTEVPLSDIVSDELVRQIKNAGDKEKLLNIEAEGCFDPNYRKQLEKNLEFVYPFEADIKLYTEISVSELKKQGQLMDAAESLQHTGPLNPAWELWLEERMKKGKEQKESPWPDTTLPSMIKTAGETEATEAKSRGYGTSRGTAYHQALQLLPFCQMESGEDVRHYLEMLVDKKKFVQENLDLIRCSEIWKFIQSPLGQRMCRAEKEGRLYKERQFIMGLPAKKMGAGNSDELVIIQGIIDAYIEEEDGLVLIDYKTDKVQKAQTLIEHYHKQIEYYGLALEQITGKAVKEQMIYSLTLHQAIAM